MALGYFNDDRDLLAKALLGVNAPVVGQAAQGLVSAGAQNPLLFGLGGQLGAKFIQKNPIIGGLLGAHATLLNKIF